MLAGGVVRSRVDATQQRRRTGFHPNVRGDYVSECALGAHAPVAARPLQFRCTAHVRTVYGVRECCIALTHVRQCNTLTTQGICKAMAVDDGA